VNTIIKNIILKVTPNIILHNYRLIRDINYRNNYITGKGLIRLKNIPRYNIGTIEMYGVKIKYVDSASFLFIYEELFKKKIYKFNTSNKKPYIIDAGANIGLSIIYFKELYPNSEIIAFEPDENVFEALEHNIKMMKYSDVKLVKKALWNSETTLNFMVEGADGGRVAVKGDIDRVVKVETVTLREYLNRKVDLLKIDIEGAEISVLESCNDLLSNVDRIFIEYHSFVNREQELHRLLLMLTAAGFRYNIQQIGIFSPNPFVQINQSLCMDNQLNIFAYRI